MNQPIMGRARHRLFRRESVIAVFCLVVVSDCRENGYSTAAIATPELDSLSARFLGHWNGSTDTVAVDLTLTLPACAGCSGFSGLGSGTFTYRPRLNSVWISDVSWSVSTADTARGIMTANVPGISRGFDPHFYLFLYVARSNDSTLSGHMSGALKLYSPGEPFAAPARIEGPIVLHRRP